MKFKVVDKVRAYETLLQVTGEVLNTKFVSIQVEYVTEGHRVRKWFHEKQCRRLKPKRKAREIWIRENHLLDNTFYSSAENARGHSGWNVKKFREVIEKPKPQGEK